MAKMREICKQECQRDRIDSLREPSFSVPSSDNDIQSLFEISSILDPHGPSAEQNEFQKLEPLDYRRDWTNEMIEIVSQFLPIFICE